MADVSNLKINKRSNVFRITDVVLNLKIHKRLNVQRLKRESLKVEIRILRRKRRN